MRRIVVVLALASVVGCTQESPIAPAVRVDRVVGAYGMASVDGYALPMQVGQEGSMAIDALSGMLELDSAATFRNIIIYRTRGSGGIHIYADTVQGTFLHFQDVLLLQPKDGSAPFFMDVTDDKTLTSWDYDVIVYKR